MLSTQPNPLFSVAEIGVLNCSGCGKPMRLACIEPDKPGFDLRTFECAKCNTGKTFLVALDYARFCQPGLVQKMGASPLPGACSGCDGAYERPADAFLSGSISS